jgi:MYXO-CTERM domain-containing protein
MFLRSLHLPILLAALLVLGAGQARAEMIDFNYHWSVVPSSIITGNSGNTGSVNVAAAPDPSSPVQAVLNSSTFTFIPGANVTTSSTAGGTIPPDVYDTNFSMKLSLTDSKSNQSGDLTFAANLQGTLTQTTSNLQISFQDPLTKSISLGGNVYTVTINPAMFDAPAPTNTAPKQIYANVTVASVPEPSGLVLGATAVLGLAGRRWLRRRRSSVGRISNPSCLGTV